ncbi:MAG: peptide ABC transporter substrate-binding protein [Solobacterium sp.]|nr:peptide ABC transporter substrate-binding protein [Solobacterium sp.]
MKRINRKLIASILTAALLSACSGGSSSGTPAETSAPADETAVSETPAAEEQRHVLNWTASGEVTTMDSSKSYDTISGSQQAYIYDTLFALDQENQAHPRLALSEPELSEDGTVAVIQIRQDAKFADGTPIKAENIVFAARRTVDPETGSQSAANLSWIANAAEVLEGTLPPEELGIEATGDYELTIHLTAPTPYLLNELTTILISPISLDYIEKAGDNYALSSDYILASGPYVLEDWTGADISWKFVKNENYWDKDNVYFEEINIQIVKDVATGVALYEDGKLDGVSISGDYITVYRETEDYLKVPSLRMTNLELGINSVNEIGAPGTKSSGYLKNLNLRKALSYAVDRQTLVGNILNDGGSAAYGFVPDGIAVNPENGKSVGEDFGHQAEYDLDLAKEYFDKALEELGTDAITLELYTSDDDASVKIGTFLQSEFQKLPGLTIDVKNVTASVRFEVMMAYDFDLALGGWTGDFDPTSYVQQFETRYAHNHGKYVSEELTDLVNKLISEDGNDFVLRWEHLKQANQLLVDNQVSINLYQSAASYLINSDLKGYETHVLGSNPVDIRFAYFD